MGNSQTNSFKTLDVSWTNFSGELPSSIGNLHSLNYFHVPSSFGNLTQLNLGYNSITGEIPSWLELELTQLTS
ncbi:hypothetical protein TB1_045009 [Malus domestica]